LELLNLLLCSDVNVLDISVTVSMQEYGQAVLFNLTSILAWTHYSIWLTFLEMYNVISIFYHDWKNNLLEISFDSYFLSWVLCRRIFCGYDAWLWSLSIWEWSPIRGCVAWRKKTRTGKVHFQKWGITLWSLAEWVIQP